MPLDVVTGAPFSGKDRWIAREIERREAAGELGLLALSYSAVFSAIAPDVETVYRDDRVSASGAPRLAGYLLAAAITEASARELDGYVATDSPRRAIAALEKTGGRFVIEVSVSEGTAHRRAAEHLTLLRSIAPRSAAAADARGERHRRMNTTEIRCAIELRAASGSPGRIVGTIIETGRVASDRRELFVPGAVQWPGGGVRLLAEHRGALVMTFHPKIDGAKIQIDTPLPDTAIGRGSRRGDPSRPEARPECRVLRGRRGERTGRARGTVRAD